MLTPKKANTETKFKLRMTGTMMLKIKGRRTARRPATRLRTNWRSSATRTNRSQRRGAMISKSTETTTERTTLTTEKMS